MQHLKKLYSLASLRSGGSGGWWERAAVCVYLGWAGRDVLFHGVLLGFRCTSLPHCRRVGESWEAGMEGARRSARPPVPGIDSRLSLPRRC